MVLLSLEPVPGREGGAAISLAAYQTALSTPRYGLAIANSLQFAFISALAATVLALPLAHGLHFHVGPTARRRLLLALALPYFSSYVLRMYGWQAWVSNTGILAWLAGSVFGMTDASGFLFTESATIVGLVSVLLPIAALIMYLSLMRMDPSLVPAARNLGASALDSFLVIELPFVVPGALVGFLFCFLLAFGDFVGVTILGGNQTYFYSIAIQDQMKIDDWPMAGALGAILLLMSLGFMAATFTLIGRSGVVRMRSRSADAE